MANYLRPSTLPPSPSTRVWSAQANSDWGMMLNDTLGDCTCAAIGHIVQSWTANNSSELTLSDDSILDVYEAVGRYDPNDPTTDKGAVELDVLNYWRNTGVGPDRHKIDAFVALEPGNHAHVRAAINLFGGIYIGLALPVSAQKQQVWSVPPLGAVGPGAPGSWGGHAVVVLDYDDHNLTFVTWGQLKQMTWGFWETYCDEAYAVLSNLWAQTGDAPSGFDFSALKTDLASL